MSDSDNKQWVEGQSGNPNGRPKKPKNASDLRPLRSKLKSLSPQSIRVIEASIKDELLDGKPVTKEQVNTSKWVVNTLTAVHKAVVAEEGGTVVPDEDDAKPVNVQETKNKLSLVMVNT